MIRTCKNRSSITFNFPFAKLLHAPHNLVSMKEIKKKRIYLFICLQIFVLYKTWGFLGEENVCIASSFCLVDYCLVSWFFLSLAVLFLCSALFIYLFIYLFTYLTYKNHYKRFLIMSQSGWEALIVKYLERGRLINYHNLLSKAETIW